MKKTARRVRKGSPGFRDRGALPTHSHSLSGRAAQLGHSYSPLKQPPKFIGGERTVQYDNSRNPGLS